VLVKYGFLFLKIICSERTVTKFEVPSVDERGLAQLNGETSIEWKILDETPLRVEFIYDTLGQQGRTDLHVW
jgi:hypothetical protein